MELVSKYKNALQLHNEYLAQLALIEDAISDEIKGLPDNPKIERIAPNMFIMNSHDLRPENWTPEHYDFQFQYKSIVMDLKNQNTQGTAFDKLAKIIETGRTTMGGERRLVGVIKLHPDVIGFLRKIANDIGMDEIGKTTYKEPKEGGTRRSGYDNHNR